MIDLDIVRHDPARIKELCARRHCGVDVDTLLALDTALRELITRLNKLRETRNLLKGREHRDQVRELRQQISELETQIAELEKDRDDLWALLPNLLAPDTPDGAGDADNVEIRTWGSKPAFDFKPKTHEVLGIELGVLDFDRATKVAGTGFYYWVGSGARLAWALFSLALDFMAERGFRPMFTPILAKHATLFGTGYLPFFADEIYGIEGQDLCLIGTSEQTLVGYHGAEVLPADSLPLLYTAFSPCLRTEAGSYGRKSKGAYRVHQFHKVEQIVFCDPAESEQWHETCMKNIEDFMQLLGIPYRVVRICTGDLGTPGYKKFDAEAWFPGFGAYRETHSNTNLLDYQTRRMSIRSESERGKFLPHTISATMITDRAALAILENNQRADGSVAIPQPLRKYMGGLEVLIPMK